MHIPFMCTEAGSLSLRWLGKHGQTCTLRLGIFVVGLRLRFRSQLPRTQQLFLRFGAGLRLQLPSGVYASTAALTAVATTGAPHGRASHRRINGASQARANITIELQPSKTTIRPVTDVQPAYVLAKVQSERAYRSLIAQ